MIEMRVSLKLPCYVILAAIHAFLGTLLSLGTAGKYKCIGPSNSRSESEQVLTRFFLFLYIADEDNICNNSQGKG